MLQGRRYEGLLELPNVYPLRPFPNRLPCRLLLQRRIMPFSSVLLTHVKSLVFQKSQ